MNTLNSFLLHLLVYLIQIDKMIITDSPKSQSLVKSVHFMQILSIALAGVAFYA